MYAYVTCRPDIGYHVSTLSKFSTAPAAIHYTMLKNVARYLRRTRRGVSSILDLLRIPPLPSSSTQLIPGPSDLPDFPLPDKPGQLIGFVDAAHANDLCRRHSTTGYAFLLNYGIIS